MTPALEIESLSKTFGGGTTMFGGSRSALRAVQPISLKVHRGETLAIVGESGCGKTTLARMLVGLLTPTTGRVLLGGEVPSGPDAFGQHIQYVFQDPISSLNPRKTVRAVIEAPLIHQRGMEELARKTRLGELLDAVNLPHAFLDRYPHELSGGQAQRVGIARALAADPQIIVLDEPVSALDVSVQAQVLNLLAALRDAYGLTYVFISHDLAVVESISDRVAVLYFGALVELADAATIFAKPRHPYTRLLAQSAPSLRKINVVARDHALELPDPLTPPRGCDFAGRCDRAQDRCYQAKPALQKSNETHATACFYPIANEHGTSVSVRQ